MSVRWSPPPSPEEVDVLLAQLSATGYASECVEIVERWIEDRFGVVGATSAQWAAEREDRHGVTVTSYTATNKTTATFDSLTEAVDSVTDQMIADLHERYP